MKKILTLYALIVGIVSSNAQTVIDNFTVGPYIVDYNGQGDVKYRLRENINLYEFFDLKKDTTIVVNVVETPIKHAFQISGYIGSTRFSPKEVGLSGIWKQKIGTNIYFNGGLSLGFANSNFSKSSKRNDFEFGIPLQIELGKLNHHNASLFGSFGLTPIIYSTLNAKTNNAKKTANTGKDIKQSGFLIAPVLEFGGNIPIGNVIIRTGVYGTYKINCTSGKNDVYKPSLGHCYLGAKIGIII